MQRPLIPHPLALFFAALSVCAEEAAPEKVWRVEEVAVSYQESDPPVPVLEVDGLARTAGWDDPHLELVGEGPDVMTFELVATPPSGIVAQVITPVGATQELKREWSGRTIRVEAEENAEELEFEYAGPAGDGSAAFNPAKPALLNVHALAVRRGPSIGVLVTGILPSSCVTAAIEDCYPGGSAEREHDPVHAKVYVETHRPHNGPCLADNVPWYAEAVLEAPGRSSVQVYVNGELLETVEVQDQPDR